MAPHKDNRYHNLKLAFERHHKGITEAFEQKHKTVLKSIKRRGLSTAGALILTSAILAGSPGEPKNDKVRITRQKTAEKSKNSALIKHILHTKSALTQDEEKEITKALSSSFNLPLTEELDGNRLNEIYGYTGAEQHLYRWPGDNLHQHDLQQSGIAPLKGAFGYFDNAEQEKYYVAIQLHELPNWNSEWVTLKPWYKFRKVFVYNPDNGKGVIAVIGDSGPSKYTGKTFGGSPEVMNYLERVDGRQKGKVVILFVDDPSNQFALGPIDPMSSLAYK